MSKEMIISVNGREKKIAILDNGKVTEFYIERGEGNSGIAGNIYKGRVQRVLPGMQSAFVSIGLERDAFLYVSDFFDEEEEIERIVMEKGKKVSHEDAKREANERIERSRIEREKQMDSAQELLEPIVEGNGQVAEAEEKGPRQKEKRSSKRDRSRQGKDADKSAADVSPEAEITAVGFAEPPPLEFAASGFERISDDEDTGEMFKDAFRQEAIVDKVRAIEFDMEGGSVTEVGSFLDSLNAVAAGFERIADEEESQEAEATEKPAPKKRGKKATGKTASEADGAAAEKKPKRSRKTAEPKEAKPKRTSRSKKKAAESADESTDALPDAEASESGSSEIAQMAVRRGGRGRRRGGKNRKKTGRENDTDGAEGSQDETLDGEPAEADTDEADVSVVADAAEDEPAEESAAPVETASEEKEPRSRNKRRDNRNENGNRNDRGERGNRGDRRDRPPTPTISDLLREGQEILVQIAKEPIAKKGARITSHIALPGRFLVYMPTIEHVGVSRKIESSSERGRLRTLIQRIRQEEDVPSGGFIVRTAGVGITDDDLRQDARYLVRTWLDIKKTSEKAKSPALVHQDLDLVQRLLRDQLSNEFSAIRVDSEEEYLRTVEFINRIQPKLVNRVKLYTRDEPILENFGVQEEIDKALKPRVWLRSGGYLVINQTEALVAIDVNTGKFVGKGNARLEDTITKTNLEAVEEIARQIRLRDLGGIIVLDLIDMEDRRNRHKVSQALQEALASDKSPTKVLSFNDFGLIIMTRKRVKQSLERTMCAPCEYCEGAGWVKSPLTICYEILAEARRISRHQEDVKQTTLRTHPDVAAALRGAERSILDEIEAYLGNVDVTADPHIHQAQFDFAFI